MSIRIRYVDGIHPVALCAAETTAEPGDIYLDDAIHEALANKFYADWTGNGIIPPKTLVRCLLSPREAHERLKVCFFPWKVKQHG